MKPQKNILLILVLLLLSAIPTVAHALTVTVSYSLNDGSLAQTIQLVCSNDPTLLSSTCSPTVTDANNVTRTIVNLQDVAITANGVSFKPFVATLATCPTGATTCNPGDTLFPRIMVEQSGSNVRSLFDNTTIKAPPRASGVSSGAFCYSSNCLPCPCTVTITAATDSTDFPNPVTNFNNSVIMSGVIKKGTAAESGGSTAFTSAPRGDYYSATGYAQGIVMNGTGAGFGVSLPNTQVGFVLPSGPSQLCAGNPSCVFRVGTSSNTSFSDSVSQSIPCPDGGTGCTPSLNTTYVFGFRFPGDKVAVPGGSVGGDDLFALGGVPVPFDALSCSSVTITHGKSTTVPDDAFSLKCDFTIGTPVPNSPFNGINPLVEEVALTLGSFSTTMLPGACQQSPNGGFVCDVNDSSGSLHFVINQNGGPNSPQYGINANGKNVELGATTRSPVYFSFQIGNDRGVIPDPGVVASIK